jgi:acetyl esterase/lipase
MSVGHLSRPRQPTELGKNVIVFRACEHPTSPVLSVTPDTLTFKNANDYDRLREDDRVRAAGVSVRSRRFGGQIHGFITMGKVIPEATILIGEIAAVLDWAFQTPANRSSL